VAAGHDETPAPAQAEHHEQQHQATTGSRPVQTFRAGRLWLNVYQNHGEHGPWFAVRLTRSYRDQDNRWTSTETLGKDDLLAAAEMLRWAFHWINRQQQGQGHHEHNGGR
jgi:hypothetical protein